MEKHIHVRLYAETVKARMDDKTLNLKRAIWTWARLALSRVKAYGNKWYKWYQREAEALAIEEDETNTRSTRTIQKIHAHRIRTARRLLYFIEAAKSLFKETRDA